MQAFDPNAIVVCTAHFMEGRCVNDGSERLVVRRPSDGQPWANKAGGEVAATQEDSLGLVISEPYGVVAAIAPWNFPLVMAVWKLAPALAAGNAVVLKPSEMTPFSVIRLAELAVQAGVPPGIFNIVQGTGQITGDALCRHPDIAKITFTGSCGL